VSEKPAETKATEPQKAAEGAAKPEGKPSLRGVLWTTKLERAIKDARSEIGEVFRAIGSKDGPTRWMSLAFVLSAVALVGTLYVGGKRWWERGPGNPKKAREQNEQAARMSEFIKKQSEDAKTRAAIVSLGSFTIELKDPETPDGKPARRVSGVMNMAEIEIVLDCGERDTRIWVEENMAAVKNQLTNVLTPVERDELFTREGKKRLRKRMMDKLNSWLPHGKVQDIYFPKLVVS
jgi:flagellar basal body-associated protein FliL